jgi:hypothetical protein
MAYIADLITNSSRTDKGLVLEPKEGFYRPLPNSLFAGTRARIAMAFSIVPKLSINAAGGASETFVTDFISDTFMFGFKYPNNQLPQPTQNAADSFAGFYVPPRYKDNFGNVNWSIFQAASLCFNPNGAVTIGTLTSPLWPALSSTNNKGMYGGNSFQIPSSSNYPMQYYGIEINNQNIVSAELGTDRPGSNSPTLSSIQNFINSSAYRSMSAQADNSPWGTTTAMFLYNPFSNLSIRVHAMGAAGFNDNQ